MVYEVYVKFSGNDKKFAVADAEVKIRFQDMYSLQIVYTMK